MYPLHNNSTLNGKALHTSQNRTHHEWSFPDSGEAEPFQYYHPMSAAALWKGTDIPDFPDAPSITASSNIFDESNGNLLEKLCHTTYPSVPNNSQSRMSISALVSPPASMPPLDARASEVSPSTPPRSVTPSSLPFTAFSSSFEPESDGARAKVTEPAGHAAHKAPSAWALQNPLKATNPLQDRTNNHLPQSVRAQQAIAANQRQATRQKLFDEVNIRLGQLDKDIQRMANDAGKWFLFYPESLAYISV
jgi:hypothetical protein